MRELAKQHRIAIIKSCNGLPGLSAVGGFPLREAQVESSIPFRPTGLRCDPGRLLSRSGVKAAIGVGPTSVGPETTWAQGVQARLKSGYSPDPGIRESTDGSPDRLLTFDRRSA